MGPYQFKARVARLRLKGGDVRDFGERALQQGAYGDDVMQLQVRCAAKRGATVSGGNRACEAWRLGCVEC